MEDEQLDVWQVDKLAVSNISCIRKVGETGVANNVLAGGSVVNATRQEELQRGVGVDQPSELGGQSGRSRTGGAILASELDDIAWRYRASFEMDKGEHLGVGISDPVGLCRAVDAHQDTGRR